MKHTMRGLNQLIAKLDETRIDIDYIKQQRPDSLPESEAYNRHLDYIQDQIRTIYGANEDLTDKLSARTRRACLRHLAWIREIDLDNDLLTKQVKFTRYHLRIVYEDSKKGRSYVKGLGEVGLWQIRKALGIK